MSIYGLNKDLSNLPMQVQRTSLSLMACRDQFDSVVVRGVSGLIVEWTAGVESMSRRMWWWRNGEVVIFYGICLLLALGTLAWLIW
jgi:hypothetical protein